MPATGQVWKEVGHGSEDMESSGLNCHSIDCQSVTFH
jgi:hypothetical protein